MHTLVYIMCGNINVTVLVSVGKLVESGIVPISERTFWV